MRIHVFSDLHLDATPWTPSPRVTDGTLADLVLLAGDIHTKRRAVSWAAHTFMQPVVMIGGNHESYNGSLYADISASRKIATMLSSDRLQPIHYLERETVILDGIRILGATLWTDYKLYDAPQNGWGTAQEAAMWTAGRSMNDHRIISILDPSNPRLADKFNGERVFLPEDALRIHGLTIDWLKSELAQPFDGATIVMTHHAPSIRSVHGRYKGDALNGAYASNLEHLMSDYDIDLWIHGHTHTPFDYMVGKTRVICNPRGYAGYGEKTGFDEELVITL